MPCESCESCESSGSESGFFFVGVCVRRMGDLFCSFCTGDSGGVFSVLSNKQNMLISEPDRPLQQYDVVSIFVVSNICCYTCIYKYISIIITRS